MTKNVLSKNSILGITFFTINIALMLSCTIIFGFIDSDMGYGTLYENIDNSSTEDNMWFFFNIFNLDESRRLIEISKHSTLINLFVTISVISVIVLLSSLICIYIGIRLKIKSIKGFFGIGITLFGSLLIFSISIAQIRFFINYVDDFNQGKYNVDTSYFGPLDKEMFGHLWEIKHPHSKAWSFYDPFICVAKESKSFSMVDAFSSGFRVVSNLLYLAIIWTVGSILSIFLFIPRRTKNGDNNSNKKKKIIDYIYEEGQKIGDSSNVN